MPFMVFMVHLRSMAKRRTWLWILVGVVGEGHAQDRLALQLGWLGRLGDPLAQRAPSGLRGRVHRPRPRTAVLPRRCRQPVRDELLGLFVDAAGRAGPVVRPAAGDLLGQLVGRPPPQGEEREDEKRGGCQSAHVRETP